MGKNSTFTRWSNELVEEQIRYVVDTLGIDHFPTQKEMFNVTGRHALSAAINNRGGKEYWSEKLGLALGDRKSGIQHRVFAVCKYCGKEFWQYRSNCGGNPQYCSSECYHKATAKKTSYGNCEWCGKKFEKYHEKHPQRFCCLECSLEYKRKQRYEHRFESGYVDANGYRVLCFNGICIQEHILLMEEKIGRKLRKDECVHHIDGCRSNNDINNLKLMTRGEHSRLHRLQEVKDGKPLFGRKK